MPIKNSSKKRGSEIMLAKSDSKSLLDDGFDPELSRSREEILSSLKKVREYLHKDGQKKNEERISSDAADMSSKLNELKSKIEKERQTFAKALSKSSKECENCLKNEAAKFQEIYEKFCKEKASHLQALKDSISRFEEDKEKLFKRYEQLRKKEKSMISEQEKFCADKITQLEESLKKKKQDDKTFSLLRKTLGSFLEDASEEDFPADD
ncbi:hypothetical protein SLA2020_473310 [Shorea laevis]